MKIFLGILAIPVFMLLLFIGYFIIADWPVNYCERMEEERERCLENPPQFSETNQNIVQKYQQEFQIPKEPKQDWTVFADAPPESLKLGYGAGYVDAVTGAQFVVSTQGSSTENGRPTDDGKNLYVRLDAKGPWEQVNIPDGNNAYNAYWINQNGISKIFVRIYSSSTFPRRKQPVPYYLYDPSTKSWSSLFWGFDERISPNHKKILIKRGYGIEFFSYFIWDVNADTLTPLFMIQEEHFEHEPPHWNVAWSDDSQAIQFVGKTELLGIFNFMYYLPDGKNYQLR